MMRLISVFAFAMLFSWQLYANSCETAEVISFDTPIQVDMTLADVATIDQINDGQTRVSHWFRLPFANEQDAGTIELSNPLTQTLIIAVYKECDESAFLHGCYLPAGQVSCVAFWIDDQDVEFENVYFQFMQVEGETNSDISFTVTPEKQGCTDPCSGTYDPYATVDVGNCTFDIVPGSRPLSGIQSSAFNLGCGETFSIETDDYLWRPCHVPNQCGTTYNNGVIWGSLENTDSSVSLRASCTDPNLKVEVFTVSITPQNMLELLCVGSLQQVNQVDDDFIFNLDFETEVGLLYVYACSINDDDDYTPTFPSASLSLSLNGCLPLNCLDQNACNYDPNSDFFNQECVYPGCNDPMAVNFDITAACSNGTCNYDLPGDLDGNDTIDVEDLLIILGSFGCLGECPGDIDGDGIVNVNDLLTLLTGFGI